MPLILAPHHTIIKAGGIFFTSITLMKSRSTNGSHADGFEIGCRHPSDKVGIQTDLIPFDGAILTVF